MGLTYRYVALTDTGLRRSNNQDSGYASDRLLVIADGMGGAAAGDLASSQALRVIRQELDREIEDTDALNALGVAVDHANARLGELIADDPAVEGMGTTLEAMVWDGEKLAWAHIGDSRVYRLRDGRLTQISTDHTFVQSLVDEGRITREEARVHPHRSLLLRAILGRDDNDADLSWLQPTAGDRYLLCSDGLTDMVDDTTIERTMRLETIDMVASELVRLALEAGGFDNVTVVLAEFVDTAAEPADDLACSDGAPQLVGAAAAEPRPRPADHIQGSGPGPSSSQGTGEEPDPEELRYAPRPPGRLRWLRWTLSVALVLAVLAGAAYWAYDWSQQQYYVAESEGRVAIYRGVEAELPGLTLSHVDDVTTIRIADLPDYQQGRVEAGIRAANRDEAEQIVANLEDAADVRRPRPTPSPSASPSTPPPSPARVAGEAVAL